MLKDFGKSSDQGKAALAAFGKSVASLELEGELDISEDLPAKSNASLEIDQGEAEFELEPEHPPDYDAVAIPEPRDPKASTDLDLELALDDHSKPNLEPVSETAHPPQNRRMPTGQHAAISLELEDVSIPASHAAPEPESEPEPEPDAPNPNTPRPITSPTRVPSPSPVPAGPLGLFSSDRITNLLAGAAVGLLITIIPAKKMASSYELKEVQPMLAELDGAIDHPLGVQAGLVEAPERVAARIHEKRGDTRRRYYGIWLLAGLPIGLGLGFAPRPW